MRLLIVTQAVDTEHPVLGFFHRWIEEFAKHCEHVYVICLQVGKYNLPANVTVHSLGKEESKGRLTYLYRFYKYIWTLRKDYDSVFVHMNQVYVVLGGLLWRLWHKKSGLWYVHRQTSTSLRLAVFLSNVIFSSSEKSMRVKTNKVLFVGHGIDISRFKVTKKTREEFVIGHFGRVTRIKNIDTIIRAIALFEENNPKLKIYGVCVSEDDFLYLQELKSLIESKKIKNIEFMGSVMNEQVPEVMATLCATINATPDGGMDKVVIESAAAGVPVFASNSAFLDFFGRYRDLLRFKYRDETDLYIKLREIILMDQNSVGKVGDYLQRKANDFDVNGLIPKLVSSLK